MSCTVLLLVKFIATATIQGKMRYIAGSRPSEVLLFYEASPVHCSFQDLKGVIGDMFFDPELDSPTQSVVSHMFMICPNIQHADRRD